MPVIETGVGNCHVYVDAARRPRRWRCAIAVNAKTHRVSVCNAAETLLVHRGVAADVPAQGAAPRSPRPASRCTPTPSVAAGRRGGRRRRRGGRPTRTGPPSTSPSTSACAVVDSLDEALEHIRRCRHRPHRGHRHRRTAPPPGGSTAEVDAAAVDGQRLDPASPTAASSASAPRSASPPRSCTPAGRWRLPELTTTKWVVEGDGQIRE